MVGDDPSIGLSSNQNGAFVDREPKVEKGLGGVWLLFGVLGRGGGEEGLGGVAGAWVSVREGAASQDDLYHQ